MTAVDSTGNFFLTLISASVLLLILIQRIARRDRHKLPPGPRGIPILGCLFQLSKTPWKEAEIWAKQYGPLVYVPVAGKGMLFLNSHEAVSELLERRAQNYSDRSRFIVASEILTGGLVMILASYGDFWKRARRATHEAMTMSRVKDYFPMQSRQAVLMVDGILRDPRNWEDKIHNAVISTILSFLYDLPEHEATSNASQLEDYSCAVLKAAAPGAHFVEFFPWMKFIPSAIAKWKREAVEAHYKFSNLFNGLFRDVKGRIDEGDDRPSFMGTLIRERHRLQLDDEESAWLGGTLYTAGSDSSIIVLVWFILAMIAYPEVQKKCQDELDSVVGRSRMPTFKDQDSLPYLRATVQEAIRWRPLSPLGIHHLTRQDDWYKGYFIPRGTMCFANIWYMNRDKSVYGEDANDFNPDRFIGQRSPALSEIKEEGHLSFGFGPRICVGRHMANSALFINIASMLWAAHIIPIKDETGEPIIPDTLVTISEGLAARPLPFQCSITPRFPEAADIVSRTTELL